MPPSVPLSKKLVARPVLPTRPVRPILDDRGEIQGEGDPGVSPVDVLLHIVRHVEAAKDHQ
jgi:hypothetical protein